jgi:hypothetical protein
MVMKLFTQSCHLVDHRPPYVGYNRHLAPVITGEISWRTPINKCECWTRSRRRCQDPIRLLAGRTIAVTRAARQQDRPTGHLRAGWCISRTPRALYWHAHHVTSTLGSLHVVSDNWRHHCNVWQRSEFWLSLTLDLQRNPRS